MDKPLLNVAKLSALPRDELWSLMLRTAEVQAQLLGVPGAELGPELRERLRFLASALLQMETELRQRDDQTELCWQLEELDPAQVVEAA